MAPNEELQTSFDAALELLKKDSFREGADLLLAIRSKGFVSADLENNLGRAFCEGGQLAQCIEHLNYAVALDRFNTNYRNDLKAAQAKVESSTGTTASHPSEIANLISSYLRPEESFGLASLLLLTLMALQLFRKITNRLTVTLGFSVIALACLGVFSVWGSSVAIVSRDVDLKQNPLEASDAIQVLKSGTRLKVLRVSGAFAEVERTNSFRGWIKNDAVTKTPY